MPSLLPLDVFHIRVMPSLTELSAGVNLAPELRSVVRANPEYLDALHRWMGEGYGLELHTLKTTPEPLLQAVKRIAELTQENTLVPWLPRLLQEGDMPTFTASEIRRAEQGGLALYEDARFILAHREIGKRLISTDASRQGAREEHERFLRDLNAALLPQAIDELLYRVGQDHASHESSVKTFTKTLIIVAPFAHVLERWWPGIGKAWVVIANHAWEEGRELWSLHSAGLTQNQALKRSRLFILVAIITGYAAYLTGGIASAGRPALAGILFGFTATALPILAALQSLVKSYRAIAALKEAGKLRVHEEKNLATLALREHLLQPEYASAYLSVLLTPFFAAILFVAYPGNSQNGWILALIGVAGVGIRELMRVCRDWLRRGALAEFRRRWQPKRRSLDGAQEMR